MHHACSSNHANHGYDTNRATHPYRTYRTYPTYHTCPHTRIHTYHPQNADTCHTYTIHTNCTHTEQKCKHTYMHTSIYTYTTTYITDMQTKQTMHTIQSTHTILLVGTKYTIHIHTYRTQTNIPNIPPPDRTSEAWCAQKNWFGCRTGWSPCACSFIWLVSSFPPETSGHRLGLSGNYREQIYFTANTCISTAGYP